MPSLSGTNKRFLFLVAALLVGTTAAGCGRGGHASISGAVKYNGRPLPSGIITFFETGSKKAVAADIADGKFTVRDLEVGPAKVTVVTLPPSHGGKPPHGQAIEATPQAPAAAKYVPIPQRYANADQSGLSYDVTPGEQTKVFELTR